MSFWTQNPYTQENLKQYNYLSDAELELGLQRAFAAWKSWRESSLEVRGKALRKLAQGLRDSRNELAKSMSLEMGKPLSEALAEVEKSAFSCEYIAKELDSWLSPEEVLFDSPGQRFILKNSLGPVLMVMPWNFPLWQVIRFAVPGLAAGNVVLLKGSDLVAGTSQILTEIFCQSLERDLLQNFCMTHAQVEKVIADPRVRGVTFTGSTRGGRQVAALAGQHLKKAVLELGGNDPYLLLKDCDLERDSRICAAARLVNTGQSCVAAKRFFVHETQSSQFCEIFSSFSESLRLGDPSDSQTQFGVLSHNKFKTQLLTQLQALKSAGAKLKWQSSRQGLGSSFFAPQIWQVDLDCRPAHQEELFGPVALVFSYKNIDDAIEAANSSPYGLGGAVFSKDLARAREVADLIESGQVAINDSIKSDVRLPFGGVKDSGFGRELSQYGFQEFLNLRTLVLAKP